VEALLSQVINKIESVKDEYIAASHAISQKPELGRKEFFASGRLMDLLDKEGFNVKKDIAGYETAFTAEKGGKGNGPTLAFLAEYDALPEIGHACGHNIIGTLSALAAVGLSEVLGETGGRVLVYGTPAEEGGDGGCAKAAFVEHGFFNGVDAALMIHPCDRNLPNMPCLAVKSYSFEFFGKTAHASACPEMGINALDAMVMLFNGVALMRQQMAPDLRVHGIITNGGLAPNIIPDYTRAKFLVRGKTKALAEELLARVIKIAEGAATATGCTFKAEKFCNDFDDMIVTPSFDRLFTESAAQFGFAFDDVPNAIYGSTDAGNVSQIIPLIHPLVKTVPNPCALHTAEFAEGCVSPYADEALVNGAKALAAAALRLMTDAGLLNGIKSEHKSLII